MKPEKKVLISAMKHSISDVLETMFFLPVDFSDSVPIETLWDQGKDNILAAGLNFGGPFSGNCVFYIPEQLAESITADFMGKGKEDISPDEIKGTVKEMTNMIAGNLFSLYDPEAVFSLSVPEQVGLDDILSGPENTIYIVADTLENHLVFQMNIRVAD